MSNGGGRRCTREFPPVVQGLRKKGGGGSVETWNMSKKTLSSSLYIGLKICKYYWLVYLPWLLNAHLYNYAIHLFPVRNFSDEPKVKIVFHVFPVRQLSLGEELGIFPSPRAYMTTRTLLRLVLQPGTLLIFLNPGAYIGLESGIFPLPEPMCIPEPRIFPCPRA